MQDEILDEGPLRTPGDGGRGGGRRRGACVHPGHRKAPGPFGEISGAAFGNAKESRAGEEHPGEPDSDVSNRNGFFDELGENRGRSGPLPDSPLAAGDADKAWEAYAELEHELKEENAAPVGSPAPNDADPNRKHGEEPGRTS